MKSLLVRDLMTIGVPICRDLETCGAVLARLDGEVVVALDDEGRACGWLTRERLERAGKGQAVGEVMEERIPTVPPDIPAETAAQIMRDRGVAYLLLMHDWPGDPRPAAIISLQTIEQFVNGGKHAVGG